MAGRSLAVTVYLTDPDGAVVPFGPGEVPPKWAAEQITNPDVWADDTSAQAEGEEPEKPAGYGSWKKADLEAEVAKRNEGRDDDDLVVVEAPGNKAELVAALEADDHAGDE